MTHGVWLHVHVGGIWQMILIFDKIFLNTILVLVMFYKLGLQWICCAIKKSCCSKCNLNSNCFVLRSFENVPNVASFQTLWVHMIWLKISMGDFILGGGTLFCLGFGYFCQWISSIPYFMIIRPKWCSRKVQSSYPSTNVWMLYW